MHPVLSHVEQTFLLAKAAGDIMVRFVGLAVVNFWELGCVGDEQQSWSDAQNGAIFFVEGEFELALVGFDVVVCDPEAGYAGPEGAREVAEGVEEAVVDYLVQDREGDVCGDCEDDIEWCEEGKKVRTVCICCCRHLEALRVQADGDNYKMFIEGKEERNWKPVDTH